MTQDVLAHGIDAMIRAMNPFVEVGVLGAGDEKYNIPHLTLIEMAQCLGGEIVLDLPPFLVVCTDALVIVMTVRIGDEFLGGAFSIHEESLKNLHQGIYELWVQSEKTMTVEELCAGTAFSALRPSLLPGAVERSWRASFC